MSNNGIPPVNDWQADNYPVIYDEGLDALQYVKTGAKTTINTGGSSYLVASVTLTDAQIKALPTAPIKIADSLGATKSIIVTGVVVRPNTLNGIYTLSDSSPITADSELFLTYGANLYNATQSFAADSILGVVPISDNLFLNNGMIGFGSVGNAAFPSNLDIYISAYSENDNNFIGGGAGNSMTILISYMALDF